MRSSRGFILDYQILVGIFRDFELSISEEFINSAVDFAYVLWQRAAS
jgi:hypothetical protein